MSDASEPADVPAVPPFLLRGVARVIDLGVQVALMDAAYRISRALPEGGLVRISPDVLGWIDLFVGLSALVLTTAIAQWLGGATLGKLCTGLRVVDADGNRITARAAFIREVAFFLDGLLLGLVAYSAMMRSDRGQRVGDQWADTYVVWRADAPTVAGAIAWRGWPVGIAVALAWVVSSYLLAS